MKTFKDMNAKQVKEWAKLLYTKERLSQKEVAERTGKAPQTINRWVKNEKWDALRVSLTITKEEQIKNLYLQLSEINKSISEREGNRYPNASEADTINKLSTAIQKLETEVGLPEIISAFTGFFDWLRGHNLEKAKELAPLYDDYVKSKLR